MLADWTEEIERVAAFLYHDETHWSDDCRWHDLSESKRQIYRERTRTIGYMFNYPYLASAGRAWGLLCACDHNPETTQGPERECPLHGELPDAVIRIKTIVQAAERYVMAGLCGNATTHEELAALIEAARTDR